MKYTKTSIAVVGVLVVVAMALVVANTTFKSIERATFKIYPRPQVARPIEVDGSDTTQPKFEPAVPRVTTLAERAKIFDAPDVLAAIERVRKSGGPDEKRWAVDALRNCFVFSRNTLADPAEMKRLREAVGAQESSDVRSERDKAFAALADRCRGAKALDESAKLALLADLQIGANAISTSPTPTQILETLLERAGKGDSRRSSVESEAVTNALYGDDPLLRRLAFGVVVSSFDWRTSEGAARGSSLSAAMSHEIVASMGPMSDFEALVQCANSGQCADAPMPSEFTGRTDPETERLMAAYREAFSKRLPVDMILSIH